MSLANILYKLPITETVELDWYDAFDIKALKSDKSFEEYSDGNRIINKTYGFIAAWNEEKVEDFLNLSFDKIKDFLTKFEQIILLGILTFNQIWEEKFIKSEGGISKRKDVFETIKEFKFIQDLNKEQLSIDSKKVIFQSRKPWEYSITNICERCGQPVNYYLANGETDLKVTFKARFNFGLLDKDAYQIKEA